MESVHRSSHRPWISEHFVVREFRDEWAARMNVFGSYWEGNADQLLAANLSEEALKEAEEDCRLDLLDCGSEDVIELTTRFEIPEGVELETVKLQHKELEKRFTDERYKTYIYNNQKYNNYPVAEPAGRKTKGKVSPDPSKKIALPDVLITVQIFRPEKAQQRLQTAAISRIPVFAVDQEFCVVGCQYLTELRDQINCVSDHAVPGEFSEDPDIDSKVKCMDIMKSGFFYIDGVFYNDMRDSGAMDYSKVIIDWAYQDNGPEERNTVSKRGIGPFSSKNMETTQFIDLSFKLGYPYVYVHQGYCEHLIVFSDLSMLNPGDSLNLCDYPMVNTLHPKRRSFCMACHIHTAKWVVTKNARLPEDPYFFCDTCFRAFNYDSDGMKIGNFEARKYFDRTLLL